MSAINPTIDTAIYPVNGNAVKVHAVQTGQISVKNNFVSRKGPGYLSKLNILLGYKYCDFMPIWTWVIEHPEGVIVIDTGDIEEAAHKEFYRQENVGAKFNLMAMSNKRNISKPDELNNQLSKLNINTQDVSKVVLTHPHGDHTDGLKFFPDNEILVLESEHKQPYGNLPTTYPKGFKPGLVNFSKDRIEGFEDGYAITGAEDLWLVPTPGHTHHHCSVLFKTDKEHILFAGDATYHQ
jgi:N-acyl homoserine lactone hydrolase